MRDEASGWSGTWVAERLGVRLRTTDAPSGMMLTDLVGLAVRRNPRRAQLLVSSVLGKHLPTDPRVVTDAALRLGAKARAAVTGDAVVLGYAETATALGHLVADAIGAPYLHSTRRVVDGLESAADFYEEHSHATTHRLLPADPAFLARGETLVLVDDEVITGKTIVNTIRALHKKFPRKHYVVAALVDLRSEADRGRMERAVKRLRATLDVVSLASGEIELPEDLAENGNRLIDNVENLRHLAGAEPPRRQRGEVVQVVATWPRAVPEGGRHGLLTSAAASYESAVTVTAAAIAGRIPDGPVHVLGTEELMYAPLRIASALADRRAAEGRRHEITYSTTTRSPVLAVDDPGYAIRTAITFPAHDAPADDDGPRFAYNLREGVFEAIVLVVDEPADTRALHEDGGLVDQLARLAPRVVVVTVPAFTPEPRHDQPAGALPAPLHGPTFGSYERDDVAWLIKDLEADAADSSSGAAEDEQAEAHRALFDEALTASAQRVAYAVGLVTEQVLARRGQDAVLVSLMRAGTPIGVLMRRWAQRVHGLDLPHYAISIVRGRGIDQTALAYLAAHHDPARVVFVDGWTGTGAIARDLASSVEKANSTLDAHLASPFSPELAVLADPGRSVSIVGTREDYLIPSACLGSTVSGLISRAVIDDDRIGPNDFHGAAFRADLARADVSRKFIDTVAARFPIVRTKVMLDSGAHLGGDHTPTWVGWNAVESAAEKFGDGDVTLVEAGVDDTVRLLLHGDPSKILVNPARDADLGLVKKLAEARGVVLERISDVPYACLGLRRP
ncbi:phosphoribosyltransferase domain-containing protein [Nocardioides albus]|uniref:Adenine/guanine phosphoribosyltransferase-like PRPP-binding protein n=1 Tax=Nocardioides albus TaxID=1841 RepID=A0A7W5AAP2_9ACTN|nr:phosphoribosyltransferase domain-containing protein [Nocardioides albus]MBB3092354.1 adenine/guanine phosphoribosyltransferase-like PRPP-binding protein [Nocardioides albus]GGU47350.1 phosphoribosyltransferase [Nocardioides albus]